MEKNKSSDFNIYYINFSKVYEIAMMINNVIITKIEKSRKKTFEEEYGFTSSISAQGTRHFLDGIKASITSNSKQSSSSTTNVVETLEVKTTKSILLRRILNEAENIKDLKGCEEGLLVKIDGIKLTLLDETSVRQNMILRRDALKGFQIEGMEINNLVGSMLQDYSYVITGKINNLETQTNDEKIIFKIPLEATSEFENKYSINDLLIGHVSIIGVYNGVVKEEFIRSSTASFFTENKIAVNKTPETKVILSNDQETLSSEVLQQNQAYHFIDILAIIQDVKFKVEINQKSSLSWWSRIIKFINFKKNKNVHA